MKDAFGALLRTGPVERARRQGEDAAQLPQQILEHCLRHGTVVIDVDCHAQLDLVPIAGPRQVGRPDDHAHRALPDQHHHLGMQQAVRHPHRQQVPAQIAGIRPATAIHEHADLRFGQALFLFEHSGDVETGGAIGIAGRDRQESAEAVLREEVGIEGERRGQAGQRQASTVFGQPVVEHLHGAKSFMKPRRAESR